MNDSSGNPLSEGDSVHVIKDLKVKGTLIVLKRGKMIKNIRLIGNPSEVECKEGKSKIVLPTAFLNKS